MPNHIRNNGVTSGILLTLLALACSREDTSWEWSLRPGTYDVTPYVCASTGEAPPFPTPEHQATLFHFDALTRHQLVVERMTVHEVLSDADCTMTLTRTKFENADGYFGLRGDRRYEFSPPGCTFTLTFQGQALPVGRDYGALFADRTDRAEEIPYEVTEVSGGYQLISRDLSTLNDLWQRYGCARPDRLKWQARAAAKHVD